MASVQILRSSDLCRTTSPKMVMKNKKRRKSSTNKNEIPAIAQPQQTGSGELGLNYVKNNNNNNNNNNESTETGKLPRRFTNPKRKVSTTPKIEHLSLSESSSSDDAAPNDEKSSCS